MKNILIVILTMLIETGVLWAISIFIHWDLMELLFIGGLVILAIPWLFLYFTNHKQNVYYANLKGMTGQDAGRIKLFRFHFSPIIIGLVLFIVLSLCLTIYHYYDDFILLTLCLIE
ncbi:Uncharacterised protein [Lysinibacillus sphaericus]|nr:Uncharacterised protein [Lysinibacillus sphaericus]